MKTLNKIQNFFFITGAFLLLVGASTYITGWNLSFYLYAVGACAFSFTRFMAGYEGHNLIVRRLRLQQIFGSVMLLVTAVLMAMNTFQFGFARRNEWIVALSVACVFELYTAFRIPAELEKEQKTGRR